MTPLGQWYWTLPIAGVICGLSVILQENWTEKEREKWILLLMKWKGASLVGAK